MDAYLKTIFLRELERQCVFALNAIVYMNEALKKLQEQRSQLTADQRAFLHNGVFRNIHSFLTHVSNTSRILWPGGTGYVKGEAKAERERRGQTMQDRASELRQALEIPSDDHPLKSRRLRDHLEHFDERLDLWASTSKRRNLVDDFIGQRGGIVGIDETDYMRWFDQTQKEFHFRDEVYDLQNVATAVESLLQKVKVESQNAYEALRQRAVRKENS